MVPNDDRQAVIGRIVRGKHGSYAVSHCDGLDGSVTFSLAPPVWNEEVFPEPGTYVVLANIVRKRAGWRANNARFVRMSDEQPSTATSN